MSANKEKFLEMLPRVGIAAESITAAIELYAPCILEAGELYWELMKGHSSRADIFSTEELQLIESTNNKLSKLEKITYDKLV